MPIVKDIKIKISRDNILKMLKFDKGKTVASEKVLEMVSEMIEEGRRLCLPRALYESYEVKSADKDKVVLQGASFDLRGKSIAHHLWRARRVTLFAVTVGPELEKRIEEFGEEGNITKAAIMDAVGSEAAEGAAGSINELINNEAVKTGFRTVTRYSPGYGDWDIKYQKGLIDQIKAQRIGITVTGSSMMKPQKSISAAIGWVPSKDRR